MKAIYWTLLALAAFSVETQAQAPTVNAGAQGISTPRPLTLDEALSLAYQHNPRLRVAGASIETAEAGITTARARLNPVVTFGTLGRQQVIQNTAVPGMLHGLNVSQPLELPSVRSTRIKAAELKRATRVDESSQTRLEVQSAVKQAFYEVLRRKGELELTRENLRLLEDLRRRIQVQVNVGEAARMELVRADAELATARIQVKSAELRKNGALSALYSAVGTPLGDIDPQATLERPGILPPFGEMLQQALAAHPSVAVAESEARRSNAVLSYQKAQRLPQPTVWADTFFQPDAAQYRFGITIPVPLFNKNEGPIAEAAAARKEAEATAQVRRLEISAAVERAYNSYLVASQQVLLFEDGTLQEAEAAVKAAEAAFKFGERGILEVLDSQRVLRAARADYLNAKFDLQQAIVDLEQLRAIGEGKGKP